MWRASSRRSIDLPELLPPLTLSAEVRHNLFLAVKEALNNVVKHARATLVQVRLRLDESSFTLTLEDDGRGFTPEAPPKNNGNHARTMSGHGLGNLEKRLVASGGICRIKQRTGPGNARGIDDLFQAPALASFG